MPINVQMYSEFKFCFSKITQSLTIHKKYAIFVAKILTY